jgi:hypothetical protein
MSKLKKAFEDPTEDAPEPTGLRVVRGLGVLPRSRIAGSSKYDLASLEIGDAFVSSDAKDVRNVAVAARAYAKKHNGTKYVTRKTEDGDYALIRES